MSKKPWKRKLSNNTEERWEFWNGRRRREIEKEIEHGIEEIDPTIRKGIEREIEEIDVKLKKTKEREHEIRAENNGSTSGSEGTSRGGL